MKKNAIHIFAAFALAVSAFSARADVVWPTPSKDFAEGRPPEAFLQPTVSGNPMSGAFGDVRNNGYKFHEGIDIKPLNRDKKYEALDDIYAAMDGRITLVNRFAGNSGYGKYVVLVHDTEDVAVYTLYAHMAEISPSMAVGGHVRAGARLGKMGRSAGGYTIRKEQAHLHFEIGLMSSMNFDKWYYGSRRFKDKNKFGNYNGINLTGFDPLDFFYSARAGKINSMAEYIKGLPTAFTVRIATDAVPDFAKMYPNLVENAGAGNGWDISFTWYGLPQKLVRVNIPAAENMKKGDLKVLRFNPDEIKRRCRVMFTVRNGKILIRNTLIDTVKKLFP